MKTQLFAIIAAAALVGCARDENDGYRADDADNSGPIMNEPAGSTITDNSSSGSLTNQIGTNRSATPSISEPAGASTDSSSSQSTTSDRSSAQDSSSQVNRPSGPAGSAQPYSSSDR